ncbi:venom phosphodiesterase-like isoform X2 [Panulirus ornatus]
MTIILMSVLLSEDRSKEVSQCSADYKTHPLLLVSMDGFRASYLTRNLTPTLQKLAEEGVHAPYMKPSYPSLTFPNHYSIVTGLYPESHGIIANSFFDVEFNATFHIGNDESLNGRWWGGEPIWVTLAKKSLKTATYFWPGSDANIGGRHPTYWFPYNSTTPFPSRVDQVVDWLLLPTDERPVWLSLYFNQPDETGHENGPDSNEVNDELKRMDQILTRLMDKLEARGLLPCVNIIVVADHGMAPAGKDRVINLAQYIPDISETAYTFTGPFTRINPKVESEEVKLEMMKKLANKRKEMRVYDRGNLPTRLHYAKNRRIEDIILDLDPGYITNVDSDWYLEGEHGYDNQFASMNALFVASGPDFKNSIEIEPFQNIELYNLMCHMTGVRPAPNNGTSGSLYHILANPPNLPPLPEEDKPPTSVFPVDADLNELLDMASCNCTANDTSDWLLSLEMTEQERNNLEKIHLPWGLPLTGQATKRLTLLHQMDHVTGYSEVHKMPLWTSVTLNESMAGTQDSAWCGDVRLTETTTATCSSYDNLSQDIIMAPLFPPDYSMSNELSNIPYMVSNAVPLSKQLAANWKNLLRNLVLRWQNFSPLNVVLGPVFDKDADSHPDNINPSGTPDIVSHLFAVVTCCKTPGIQLELCPHNELDAISFILPQFLSVSNNLEPEIFTQEFSAKVRDVEIATGLTFYQNIDVYSRTALVLKIHSDLWT